MHFIPKLTLTPILKTLALTSIVILSACTAAEEHRSEQTAQPVIETSAPLVASADSAPTLPAAQAPAEGLTKDTTSTIADAATILSRKQVPILCYHQIRDWKASDSKAAKDYIVPTDRFREQIRMLADSGYHTILPDQLFAYLTTGVPLPDKPILLTFDDTNLDQYTVAAPELEKYGFKGVFFVMTVSLGRPNYMSKAQVKELSDRGHAIGSHTWDHHNVKKYQGEDWVKQIEKPARQLEAITGKPTLYFAYPFGLWNEQAIPELQKRGVKGAFQLAAKRDEQEPLYTVRRIIASGYWSSNRLYKNMISSF
ncbi:polysaccharide deacetylase family protein [Pontibacter ruber]|uniref:Polysaccharide deacetylase family protein n=1 Tax=Pontibacter ruber TaxID=1343895 RepID=A0ABW5D1G9_9BACT|nr:polysaccharide deacetylase family protein [Pontibacter ruber]